MTAWRIPKTTAATTAVIAATMIGGLAAVAGLLWRTRQILEDLDAALLRTANHARRLGPDVRRFNEALNDLDGSLERTQA